MAALENHFIRHTLVTFRILPNSIDGRIVCNLTKILDSNQCNVNWPTTLFDYFHHESIFPKTFQNFKGNSNVE